MVARLVWSLVPQAVPANQLSKRASRIASFSKSELQLSITEGIFMSVNSGMSQYEISRINKMLIMLFKHWDLSANDQLNLLGISNRNRLLLYCYRYGNLLSNDRDKVERAVILLSISASLRGLFPNNRNLAYSWMKVPNRAFRQCTPIRLIQEQGMMGPLHCAIVPPSPDGSIESLE